MPSNKVPIFRSVFNVRPEEEPVTAPVFLKLTQLADLGNLHRLYRNGGRPRNTQRRLRDPWLLNAFRLITEQARRYEDRYFDRPLEDLQGLDPETLAFNLATFSFAARTKADVARLFDWFSGEGIANRPLVLPGLYLQRNPKLVGQGFDRFGPEESSSLFVPAGHLQGCAHCTGRFPGYSMSNVAVRGGYTSLMFERWCPECVNTDSFSCDISGNRYYDGRYDASSTVDGQTICHEIAPHLGYAWDESADEWYHDSDDDDDEDYDDDRSRSRIPAYHDSYRPPFEPPLVFRNPSERTYGIELEVNFVSFEDRESFFGEHFNYDGGSKGGLFSMEHDGSLEEDTGIEVIGVPMSLATYQQPQSPWETMCKLLFEAGAHGWPVRAEYGMHVNVDIRPLLTTINQAYIDHAAMKLIATRFTAFILNNKELTTKLAGRDTAYSSIPMAKTKSLAEAGEMLQRGKYNPVFLKAPHLMEVRIFGSNVKYEGIKRNVEYVDSGLAFITENPDALFSTLTTSAYRNWMLLPHNKKRWPTMSAYLEPKITPENFASKRAAA